MSNTLSDDVILVHQDWVARFENFVTGVDRETLDPAHIGDDAACLLGRWLHANPHSFPSARHFEQADALHQRFHASAAAMATVLGSPADTASVRADLDRLHALSIELVQALHAVRAKAV